MVCGALLLRLATDNWIPGWRPSDRTSTDGREGDLVRIVDFGIHAVYTVSQAATTVPKAKHEALFAKATSIYDGPDLRSLNAWCVNEIYASTKSAGISHSQLVEKYADLAYATLDSLASQSKR